MLALVSEFKIDDLTLEAFCRSLGGFVTDFCNPLFLGQSFLIQTDLQNFLKLEIEMYIVAGNYQNPTYTLRFLR